MTRLFYTTGKQDIIEEEWDKPEIQDNEIEVKSVYTGVCRSDIDMYAGTFQLLPKTIQGHESVGIVTKAGKLIKDVKEGDFVATRGEPAFADYYNCKERMYVKIPELNPKYILEPIACGINIARSFKPIESNQILILGTGFLAQIVYEYLDRNYECDFVVSGNANLDYWKSKQNVELTSIIGLQDRKFSQIIDLSDKPEYLDLNIYAECATIILAAEKHPMAMTTFGQFLWNAVTIKFPSPRNETFYSSMNLAKDYIIYNDIDVSNLWTKSYNRETEVKLAFEEGLNRPIGYSRGYIEW